MITIDAAGASFVRRFVFNFFSDLPSDPLYRWVKKKQEYKVLKKLAVQILYLSSTSINESNIYFIII